MVRERLGFIVFAVSIGWVSGGFVTGCCCWHTSPVVNTPKVTSYKLYEIKKPNEVKHSKASVIDVKSASAATSVSPSHVAPVITVTPRVDLVTSNAKVAQAVHGVPDAKEAKKSAAAAATVLEERWECVGTMQCPGTVDDYTLNTLVILSNGHVGTVFCDGREATVTDLESRVTVKTLRAPERSHFYPASVLVAEHCLVAPLNCSEIPQLQEFERDGTTKRPIDPLGRVTHCQLRVWDITATSEWSRIFYEKLPRYVKKDVARGLEVVDWTVDPKKVNEKPAFTSELAYLCALAVCPDGRLLSGSANGTIKIWDVDTLLCTRTLGPRYESRFCERTVRANYHNDDMVKQQETMYVDELLCSLTALSNLHALYGLCDGKIGIVNLKTGQRFVIGTCHHRAVTALVTLSEELFASGSADGMIKIWQTDDDDDFDCVQVLRGHRGRILSLVSRMTKTGRELLSLDSEGEIKIWRL